MTNTELLNTGKIVVGRNMSPSINSALIGWDEWNFRLTLLYFTQQYPTEEDRELCELALGELVAEFSEIAAAEGDVLHESQLALYPNLQSVYPLAV